MDQSYETKPMRLARKITEAQLRLRKIRETIAACWKRGDSEAIPGLELDEKRATSALRKAINEARKAGVPINRGALNELTPEVNWEGPEEDDFMVHYEDPMVHYDEE